MRKRDYRGVRRVQSLHELIATPLADGVNALCWERTLAGDFGEVVARLGFSGEAKEGVVALDEARLLALPVSEAGRAAVTIMLEDLRLLRDRELDPVLNCIRAYPRDEDAGPVAMDVFSWHADSAPIQADTWLCTYHGAPSEGLRNDEALRRVDIPETRAELLRLFGGQDNEEFQAFLKENCFDLHYVAKPGARPFSFGVGHLWRIACDWPGCSVPPCIHRAPDTGPGPSPRLLLIS